MNITKKLIKYNFTPDANKPEYIVIHDTGNKDAGANALMHYRYFAIADRQASAHFFVDSDQVLQFVEVKDKAWHCGDGHGKNGIDNSNSIGIEICINSDGDYVKTIDNTTTLCIDLMRQYSIPIEKVVRHYDASRKNCPQTMNNNGDWTAWTGFKKTLLERMNVMDEIKTTDEALNVLVDKKIIESPDYWLKVLAIVKFFDVFIIKVANALK